MKNKYFMTTEKFISKCIEKHGNKYDYSLVKYISYNIPVSILCSIHGIFEQKPTDHKDKGRGCQKCAIEKSCFSKKDTNYFIKKSNELHKCKYDYSLVEYKNMYTKVKISCAKHGIFEQTPISHLRKKGCPLCKESKGEIEIAKMLDNLRIKYKRQFKFQECKNKYQLSFDFFLLDKNICIEYDGRQHYEILSHIGKEKYIKQTINDDIKDKFCKEKNILLIRIRYDDIIEEKINTINGS